MDKKPTALVIGGGIAGLTSAYYLSKNGINVHLFEKEDTLGGIAKTVLYKDDKTQFRYEYVYHHFFKKDKYLIKLVKDLGLGDNLEFKKVKNMYANYIDNILDAFLYGVLLFPNWKPFLRMSFKDYYSLFGKLGKRLLNTTGGYRAAMFYKFGSGWQDLPLSWLWARIHSRFSLTDFIFGERLGVLKPSLQVFIDKLTKSISFYGGKIHMQKPVKDIKNVVHKYNADYVVFATGLRTIKQLFKNVNISLFGNIPKYRVAVNIVLVFDSKYPDSKIYPKGVYWESLPATKYEPFIVKVHQNILNDAFKKDVVYLGGYINASELKDKYKFLLHKKTALDFIKDKFGNKFDFSKLADININVVPDAQPIITKKMIDKLPKNCLNFKCAGRKIYGIIANFGNLVPWDRGVNFAVYQGIQASNYIIEKAYGKA